LVVDIKKSIAYGDKKWDVRYGKGKIVELKFGKKITPLMFSTVRYPTELCTKSYFACQRELFAEHTDDLILLIWVILVMLFLPVALAEMLRPVFF